MTSKELHDALVLTKQGLESNKQVMQPELLELLKAFIAELRKQPSTIVAAQNVAALAPTYGKLPQEFSLDKFLTGLSNVLNVEEKLIGKEGDTVIRLLDGLSNRSILLSIIARFM